jgi:hypothetical protein
VNGLPKKIIQERIIKIKTFFVTLTFFLLTFTNVNAQETMQFYARISPEVLIVGSPFTLTILLDYPFANEVSVIPPSYEGVLKLDRVIKYARGRETRTQTVVEYTFTPIVSRHFVLESFTIVTPLGRTATGQFVLNIRREGEERMIITPSLAWESDGSLSAVPRQITAGERLTFLLRATDFDSQLPPPEFFMPEVPQGVILTLSRQTAQERTDGVLIKMTVIPLAPGEFTLPERVLQYENIRFQIPALNVRVVGRSAN